MSILPTDPTHFSCILLGTSLPNSILAAALSLSGYSILHLDSNSFYGDTDASLSLSELLSFPGALIQWKEDKEEGEEEGVKWKEELMGKSSRFSLSLNPTLLRSVGVGLDLIVRSGVGSYLGWGLLGGVGVYHAAEGEGEGKIERVPGSKSEVFGDSTLSLVEKRRLTKLLLMASTYELPDSPTLEESTSFTSYLSSTHKLPPKLVSAIAYALSFCSSPDEPTPPSLLRLSKLLRSTGRFGPSPLLVGHYGLGELVGGFARICAIWGGGQILGKPIGPLIIGAEKGREVVSTPLFGAPPPPSTETSSPPPSPPPPPTSSEDDELPVLGVPVSIDPSEPPSILTTDFLISSSSHLPYLLSSSTTSSPSTTSPPSIHSIHLLPSPGIPFPLSTSSEEREETNTDSNLFVFEPSQFGKELGTVMALQVGVGTMSCPEGFVVLHLFGPILNPSEIKEEKTASNVESLFSPYLSSLLSLTHPPLTPFLSIYLPPSTSPSSTLSPLPKNVLITPTLPSEGKTESLVERIDESVVVAEEMFWKVVGENGRREGVEFFPKRDRGGEEEDE